MRKISDQQRSGIQSAGFGGGSSRDMPPVSKNRLSVIESSPAVTCSRVVSRKENNNLCCSNKERQMLLYNSSMKNLFRFSMRWSISEADCDLSMAASSDTYWHYTTSKTGSRFILSNYNQEQLCGFWIHVSLLDFGLWWSLITASMSSKMYSTAPNRENFAFDRTFWTSFRSNLSRWVGTLVWFWLCLFVVVLRDEFPRTLSLVLLNRFGEEWNTFITKSQRSRAGIPSMRKPASREIISASVELCETEVCFLHIQLTGTNVLLPKMQKSAPDVDFESSRSPAKSESWNNPNLHCCAACPTWQYCLNSHVWWMFVWQNLSGPPSSNQVCRHKNTSLQTCWQKWNFTRDEWNNHLHLFNINHFSLLCCSQNFGLTSCTKTMQEQRRTEQHRGIVKADDDEPGLHCLDKFFDCAESVALKSLEILEAPCRTDWSNTGKPDAKEHNQDAALSSQGWQKDAVLDESTRRLVATEEDQKHLNYPEDSVSTRQLVASRNSETEGGDKAWPHNLQISTNYVLHMEKVSSIVRQRYGLSPTDQMQDLDVKTAVLCFFYVCHSSSCSSSW